MELQVLKVAGNTAPCQQLAQCLLWSARGVIPPVPTEGWVTEDMALEELQFGNFYRLFHLMLGMPGWPYFLGKSYTASC